MEGERNESSDLALMATCMAAAIYVFALDFYCAAKQVTAWSTGQHFQLSTIGPEVTYVALRLLNCVKKTIVLRLLSHLQCVYA